MRSLIRAAALVASAAALLAGCGGDGDGSAGDPLSAALAYMPADTPFAAAFNTDLDSEAYQAIDGLIEPVAGAGVREALSAALAASGAPFSFEDDIEPALGNPVVISATDVTTFIGDSEDDDFVAAIQAADEDTLDQLIEDSGVEETGEVGGATVYGDELAIDDDVVVLAGSEQLLAEALERADAREGLSDETFDDAFEGLPDDAWAYVYFNVGELIANDPDTEQARAVPWVAALTTFGLTFSVSETALSAEFNLRSDGEELTDQQLPIASGSDAPGVVRLPGEIGAGLRDPSQIVTFFEEAFSLVDPDEFATYEDAKPVIADQFGIDLDQDVFGQLTGDVAASATLDGEFSVRAEVADPAAFTDTVDALAEALPVLSEGEIGPNEIRRAGDLYTVEDFEGRPVAFGVVDDVFVVAPSPAAAEQIAGAQPEPVSGAQGSLVASADLGAIVGQALDALSAELGGEIGIVPPRAVLNQLGELSASLETSSEATRGRISLALE